MSGIIYDVINVKGTVDNNICPQCQLFVEKMMSYLRDKIHKK